MLQTLRSSTRHPVVKIFLVLVLIAFGALGLGSFVPSMQMKSSYITVGKTEISINQIANEFNAYRNQFMPNKSPVEALDLGLLDIVIDFLTQEALLLEEARVLGLTVSRDVQKQSLRKSDVFQDDQGNFDASRFRTILLQNGLSENQYLDLVEKNILKQQLVDSITESARYPKILLELIAKYNLEERNITIINIPGTNQIKKPNISILEKYLSDNSKKWEKPARRIASYFTIKPNDFINQIEISDLKLKEEFENRKNSYDIKETRSYNQVIFDNEDEALKNYNEILNGQNFNDITQNNEKLKISKIDKINITQIPQDISEPLFNAKINDIIKPIKSEFGYHLIELVEINPFQEAKFQIVKNELKQDLIQEKALDLVYELANFIDDGFASGKSMEEIAHTKELEIITSNKLSQDQDLNKKLDLKNELENNQLFLKTLWSLNMDDNPQLIDNKNNSFFAIKLKEKIEPLVPNLNEIKYDLETDWMAFKNKELKIEKAEKLLKSSDILKQAKEMNLLINTKENISRSDPSNDLSSSVFKLQKINDTNYHISGNEVSIIILDKIIESSSKEINDFISKYQSYYDSIIKTELASSFISNLKNKHSIKVSKSSIVQALGLTRQ